MALVNVGGPGIPFPNWSTYVPATPTSGIPATQSQVMDAAGEMVAFIGHVWFAAGDGTSKTLSNAGAGSGFSNIQWRSGAVTWSSSGTIVKIGIQDVSASAGPIAVPDEDWTGEPVVSWTQGTNALSANTWTTSTITSGSRSLTHGDLIAVVFDMTVRNGTDSVTTAGLQQTSQLHRPVVSAKTTGTWAAPAGLFLPNVVITCDDGTLCTLKDTVPFDTLTTRTINTGTTPDEIGNVINIPFDCRTSGLWTNVDPDNEFELSLYSAPVTSPVSEQAVTVDPNQVLTNTGRSIHVPITAETLAAGSAYAVTVRPTTGSSVSVYEVTVNNAAHFAFWPGGTAVYKCSRSDDTGVFATDTAARILCGISIDQLDDGTTATAGQLKTGEIVNGVTGTYDGSDRWTDPGDDNVEFGIAYKANSTSNNKTGTFVVPTEAQVEEGVLFGGDGTEFEGSFSGGVTAAEIADAVWDEVMSGHTTSGTFGAFVQKLLTVAKFLGLK